MVHRLATPNEPRNAVGMDPMTVSLRYKCACGNRELLTIQAVIDTNVGEEIFIGTMRQLWRDMGTEIAQHLKEQDDA